MGHGRFAFEPEQWSWYLNFLNLPKRLSPLALLSDSPSALIGQVISIGDELTSGQRLDTNSQWLSQQLTNLGIQVLFHATIADDLDANVVILRDAIERADVVVCTGGLGPTADDLTREAIAAAVEVPLEEDAGALEHIRNMFESRGRSMPESNALQALFPQGSQQILNPNGTAPGIEMRIKRTGRLPCALFALPGVPAEMFPMWEKSVGPAIAAARPAMRVTRHRRIKCFGAGESHIEAMLPDMIRRGRDPLVGITASSATITLRISASGTNEAECLAKMEPTVAEIYETLKSLVYGEEDDEVEHVLVKLLRDNKKTISVVEGGTKGHVAQLLADADIPCDTFCGGTVRWSRPVEMLGDSTERTDEQDAVLQAQATRRHFRSDLGLAISHWGLDHEVENVPSVTIALVDAKDVKTKKISYLGNDQLAQIRASRAALNFVRLSLLSVQ